MSIIKMNLDRMNRPQKRAFAQNIHDSMSGNASFTTPLPPLADLLAAVTASKTADDDVAIAKTNLKNKRLIATAKIDELTALIRQEGNYVQAESNGDKAIIVSAGMEVRDDPTPVHMTQVLSLAATFGPNAGSINLNWDGIQGASSYEMETCANPLPADSWASAGVSTKSSALLESLPIGEYCRFRVRAIGANGAGPWSAAVMNMVA